MAANILVCGDEQAVLADKAYESMTRRETLAESGITDRIMHRRHAGRRQPNWQKWITIAITPLHRQIEKLFGTMKRRHLYYRGLIRNRCSALAALCRHEPATGGSDRRLTGIEVTASIDPVPISGGMGRNFQAEALTSVLFTGQARDQGFRTGPLPTRLTA